MKRCFYGCGLLFCLFMQNAVSIELTASDDLLIGPYLQRPATDEITIMWETKTPVIGMVEYGDKLLKDATMEIRAATTHQIRLTDLKPGTRYLYRALYQDPVIHRFMPSQFYTFQTAPPPGTRKFRLAVFGDSRSNPEICAQIGDQIAQASPDLILHSGDLVVNGKIYETWKTQFFDPLKNAMSSIPLLPVLGNHENNSGHYYNYFDLPNNKQYWSMEYAHMLILGLDSDLPAGAATEQTRWLEQELAKSLSEWKVVFFHHPLFAVNTTRPISDHRWVWEPLFEKYGVNLVITGHDHYYLRTYPIGTVGAFPQKGTYHITAGGGGAPLYPTVSKPYAAVRMSLHHWINIDVDGDRMIGRVLDANGKGLDAFVIDQQTGAGPDEFVSYEMTELEERFQTWAKESLDLVALGETAERGDRIVIDNPFKVPVRGSIRWNQPENWKITPKEQPLVLKPEQPLIFDFTAAAPATNLYPLPSLEIELQYDNQGKDYKTPPLGFRNTHFTLYPLKAFRPTFWTIQKNIGAMIVDGKFTEPAWEKTKPLPDFYLSANGTVPQHETRAALLQDGKTLWIRAAIAQEIRSVSALAPNGGKDNKRLAQNENLQVLIYSAATAYRFLVSMNGDILDLRDGDETWNTEWQAQTQQNQSGWQAEIAIPFSAFAGNPQGGWKMDLIRNDTAANETSECLPALGRIAEDLIHAAEVRLE